MSAPPSRARLPCQRASRCWAAERPPRPAAACPAPPQAPPLAAGSPNRHAGEPTATTFHGHGHGHGLENVHLLFGFYGFDSQKCS